MTDYYQILGLTPNASPEEIKKTYRSLAMKHHPDRGGEQSTFKEISVAYDTLSDPQKKAEYDYTRLHGGHQFKFNSHNFQDINDIFQHGSPFDHIFGDIFSRQQYHQKNKDLNIQCQITLLDSFTGKQIDANFTAPSGRPQSISINIPAGVDNGATIRYQGLGDDSFPQIPRGNLNVTVSIQPDSSYSRSGDDLVTFVDISPIEAMIGCTKKIKSITGEESDLEIRPGVESNTEFAKSGLGFVNLQTNRTGRFVILTRIKTPAVTNPVLVEKLRQLNNEINA